MRSAPWRLPGYRVERLIGAGGFSEVWQGRVRATDAAVALKRIPLIDPAQRQAALSEAALLSALDHPHLVRLHRLVHIDGAVVLVLDLASGGSLASVLASRGRLTPGETITALAPVAAALAQAHNASIVHGDVTPANVLFTESGLPLLADLGVARLLGDLAPVRTTPEYADPTLGADYLPTPASDVFMLGAVTLHTVTGQLPWPGSAPVQPSTATRWRADVGQRLDAAGVAPEMATVILRALTVEPELRGTAADFALDLRHAGQPVAVELSAGRSRVEPSLARLAAIAADRPAGAAAAEPLPASALPFTHGVRVPSPLAPREPRHRSGARSRALSTPIAVLLTAIGLIVAALVWWPNGNHPRPSADPGPTTGISRSRPHSSSPAHPSRTPARSRGSGRPLDAARAQRVLERLDSVRAAAFAARDSGLLRQVYASRPLLTRDTSLLTATVPVGCGLRGVRTSFAGVRISAQRRDFVRLRVRAVLGRSTLVCGNTRAGTAAGAGPAELRIELNHVEGSYRIASQRVVA